MRTWDLAVAQTHPVLFIKQGLNVRREIALRWRVEACVFEIVRIEVRNHFDKRVLMRG
jgi:hypothetical protein